MVVSKFLLQLLLQLPQNALALKVYREKVEKLRTKVKEYLVISKTAFQRSQPQCSVKIFLKKRYILSLAIKSVKIH